MPGPMSSSRSRGRTTIRGRTTSTRRRWSSRAARCGFPAVQAGASRSTRTGLPPPAIKRANCRARRQGPWGATILARATRRSALERFTIRLTISGVEEICRTLTWREILETGADDRPQVLDRTGGGLAKDRFELGEELLDRIEIRTVRREVEKNRFARLDSLADARKLVNADVVHDDDVDALESWSQDLLDVGQEAPAIHRPIQQQGRRDAIVAQRRNEGRRFPMAIRYLADEPLTARSATVATGHVCGCAGFIDEHQLSRIKPGLHLAPCLTRRGDVRPVLFGRVQAFF